MSTHIEKTKLGRLMRHFLVRLSIFLPSFRMPTIDEYCSIFLWKRSNILNSSFLSQKSSFFWHTGCQWVNSYSLITWKCRQRSRNPSTHEHFRRQKDLRVLPRIEEKRSNLIPGSQYMDTINTLRIPGKQWLPKALEHPHPIT